MSVPTITRRLLFEAGHRVMGHEGKCAQMHGHRYVCYFTVAATKLDGIGRVIDFGVIKKYVGSWIDDNWDHAFLYCERDEVIKRAFEAFEFEDAAGNKVPPKTFAMPNNPTAENIADFLLRVICPQLLHGKDVVVTEVTVWETENCYATARR